MLKELNKIRTGLKAAQTSVSNTPLWDQFYIKEQNRKFKNKWDKVKRLNA